jgi:hypothetical protein
MRDQEQIAPGKEQGQGGSKGQGEAQAGACSDVPIRLHGVMAVTGRWSKPVDSRCCKTVSGLYLYISDKSSRSACRFAGLLVLVLRIGGRLYIPSGRVDD